MGNETDVIKYQKAIARLLIEAGIAGLTVADLAKNADLIELIRPGKIDTLDEASISKVISRYLEDLEKAGFAQSQKNGGGRRAHGGAWTATATTRDFLEGVNYALAFAILAADEHLAPALPPRIRKLIDEARSDLEDIAPDDIVLQNRVKFEERGPTHKAIDRNDAALEVVSEALYKRDIKRITIRYSEDQLTPKRSLTIDPLGIVVRKQVTNLVAFVRSDDENQYPVGEPRHFKMHLIEDAQLTGEFADPHEAGALNNYLTHMFGLPAGEVGKINLSFKIERAAGTYLLERPLIDSQTYKDEGEYLVFNAKVANTQELRWWLLAFGSKLEVLGPPQLREEMKNIFRNASSLYGS